MKVIRPFLDKKNDNKPYRKGDSFNSEDEKRVAFLLEQGFLDGELPKEEPKKKKKAKKESK
jgi:hypothetical protein